MKQIAMTALPSLGDLPDKGAWIGANQATGYTRVIQDNDGTRELECGIQGAKDTQVGARAFYNDSLGRWLSLQEALRNGNVLIRWDAYISDLQLVDGDGKWLTCGPEIKDDEHPNALVQTNLAQVNGFFYYWLNGSGLGSCAVPLHEWHTVEIELASDYYTLRFKNDYLQVQGKTSHEGLAGMAWCVYGNNLATNNPYYARFRNFSIYEENVA